MLLYISYEIIYVFGEGICRRIQYCHRLLKVCSTWLRSHGDSSTAANHLHRLCLSVDYHADLYAEAAVMRREAETEDSGRHQLCTSCSRQ